MAANNLGTAYIKIAPQMQGIQKSISDGLAGIKTSSIPGATAVGTVVAKGVSAAMNLVTSSLDGAIRRTDILNNFPKVMANLGISTKDAQKAIEKLNKGLDGLPTTLQDGASAVQRFTSKNNDVKKSTEIFLALNNAILAGGAPTEQQATALEQLSQAYAKGKPDMMEWRSAYSAMPAQLNQVAEAMGLGKNAADKLGEKLRSGKISMDDFMNAIIKLNTKGVGKFASFEKQARDASGGIGTAMTNLSSRAQKAVGTIIQAFGSKDISDAINKFSSSFGKVADWIGQNIVPVIKSKVIPALKNVLTVMKNVVEFIRQNEWVQHTLMNILNIIIAYKAVSAVKSAITGIITPIISMAKNLGGAVSAFTSATKAGLTFSSAMGAASTASKGAISSITGIASAATASHGAIGGLVSSLTSLGTVAGIFGLLAVDAQALYYINTIEATKAKTAMRNFENQCINTTTAQRDLNAALNNQKSILKDLKDALNAQDNAELNYLEAKKEAALLEREYNDLKKKGTANTDELREAELRMTGAIKIRDEMQKKLNQSIKSTKDTQDEYFGNQVAGIYTANQLATTQEIVHGKFAMVAAQLDNLSKSTITYKDANGNLAQATKEKSQEMADSLAQNLTRVSSTWAEIYTLSQQKGISLAAATAEIGKKAGNNLSNNFAMGVQAYTPLATDAAKNTAQSTKNALDQSAGGAKSSGQKTAQNYANGIKDNIGVSTNAAKSAGTSAINGMKTGSAGACDVGKNMTQGAANGVVDKAAKSSLFSHAASVVATAIAKMKAAAQEHSPSKATAEIGKFLSLGLAKGIDDYADDAVEAAKDMTTRTISAMSEDYNPGLTMNQLQPQTALTSALNGSGGQVTQYNNFEVNSELDVKEISKRLGWQVATAL